MNRHSLHYIDLHPKPIDTREPSTLAVLLGAAFALFAFWCVTVFLFSL